MLTVESKSEMIRQYCVKPNNRWMQRLSKGYLWRKTIESNQVEYIQGVIPWMEVPRLGDMVTVSPDKI